MLLSELAIGCSQSCVSATADILLFLMSISQHKKFSRQQSDDEKNYTDDEELNEKFSYYWQIQCDKEYIGSQEEMKVICPKKNSINGKLTLLDTTGNQKVSHDRVLVEIYFERLCTFGNFDLKVSGNEELYGQYICTGVSLTNPHIMYSPLKADDAHFFRTVIIRLFFFWFLYPN